MNKFSPNFPEGMNLHHEGGQLHITRKWSDPYSTVLIIFIIAWDFFYIFFAGLFLKDVRKVSDLLMLLVPLLFGCVTIVLNYYIIAEQVNTTFIDIDNEILAIEDRPLPFWGSKRIPLSSIRKVYCAKFTTRGRVFYRIRVITNDGKNTKITDGIHDYEQALFIKREIRNYLGLIFESNKS